MPAKNGIWVEEMMHLFTSGGKMFDFRALPLIDVCIQNSCWPIYSCLKIFICELRTSKCRISFVFSNMQKHNLALKWKDPNSSKMGFIPKQLKNCQELQPLMWTCFPDALLLLSMLIFFSSLFKHLRYYWYFMNAFFYTFTIFFPSGLNYSLPILICLQMPQWVRGRAPMALTNTTHDIVSLLSLVDIFQSLCSFQQLLMLLATPSFLKYSLL